MEVYAKRMFGMYGGEEQTVKIKCENHLAGVMIDRFGKDICLQESEDNHFVVNVKVAVSSQFSGWIFAIGEGAEIIGPDEVVQLVDKEVERLTRQYGTNVPD